MTEEPMNTTEAPSERSPRPAICSSLMPYSGVYHSTGGGSRSSTRRMPSSASRSTTRASPSTCPSRPRWRGSSDEPVVGGWSAGAVRVGVVVMAASELEVDERDGRAAAEEDDAEHDRPHGEATSCRAEPQQHAVVAGPALAEVDGQGGEHGHRDDQHVVPVDAGRAVERGDVAEER